MKQTTPNLNHTPNRTHPGRETNYPIEDLFLARWSPRAMSGESLTYNELFTLFEAARWAPSSFNNQPWRFIFAKKGTPHWKRFLDLLTENNRKWACNAGALAIIASKTTFDATGKLSRTHSFDTGSAWENLALQATAMQNIVVHPIEGFDYEQAAKVTNIPPELHIEAMIVIGRPGDSSKLPEDLQQSEQPNERKMLQQIVFEGMMV